jgi:Phosphotransferase enzyme family
MMREFPTLLIDDDDDLRRDSEDHIKVVPWPKLTALGQVDKDGHVIDDTVYELLYGFYLLAILDLKIGKDPILGKKYAEILREHQPLCERILSSHVLGGSTHPADSETLGEFFGPLSNIFSSFMHKGHPGDFKNIILDRSSVFGLSDETCVVPDVKFEWGDFESRLLEWANRIATRTKRPSATGQVLASMFNVDDGEKAIRILTQSLKFECDYLVSRVCGQGSYGNQGCPVDEISLSLLDEGKSSSLVLMGQPTIKGIASEVWLVFKIDLKERIITELSGFDNYIKFRVARGRRVEVLGHAVGNRLGTICYTFVGANPETPITLKTFLHQAVFENNRDNIIKVGQFIEKLFSKPDLHEVRDQRNELKQCVRDFSKSRLGGADNNFDLDRVWTGISKDIRELFKRKGIGSKMPKPNEVLTATLMGTPQPKCWSHGDLHLSNIVLGKDDDLILIDFRDTGPAPQVWDFMTLATSVRLEASCFLNVQYNTLTLKSVLKDERMFLEAILDPNRQPLLLASEKNPDWRSLLICIIQWMKKTFPEHALKDLRREFIACSFAWCCYIFNKIKDELELLRIDDKQIALLERKQCSLALHLVFLAKTMVAENK